MESPAKKASFEVGTRVIVNSAQYKGHVGTVKYFGPVSNSTGSWVGVELDTPQGKNNGVISGKIYFECKENHGLFLRPNQIKFLEEELKRKGTSKKREDGSKKDSIREEVRNKIAERKQAIGQQLREKRKAEEDKAEESSVLLAEKEEAIKQAKKELSEKKKEIEELRRSHSEHIQQVTNEKDKTIKELKEQIKKVKDEKPAVDVNELQEMIESLTLEKEIAEGNVETLTKENEEMKVELEELKEEIEIRNLEMEQLQSEGSAEDTEVEAAQLKLALQKLYTEHQNSKQNYEQRIQELENELADIPQIEQQLQQIQDLKTQLQEKEEQINSLNDALEEAQSYSDMIENLTEENLKSGERVKELEAQVSELQELHELEEQIAEDQAEIEKGLHDEIHNRDVEIQNLQQEIENWEQKRIDYEKIINQFRVRVCELNNDLEALREQLADSGEEEKMKKMQELMEKNVWLSGKIREMLTHYVEGKDNEISYEVAEKKMQFVLASIPDTILESLALPKFNSYCLLRSTRRKAFLCVQSLVSLTLDTPHEKPLTRWIFNLSSHSINLYSILSYIEEHIFALTPPEFNEFMLNLDWGQMSLANSSIDNFLKLVKEGGLSSSIPLENYLMSIEYLEEFQKQNVPGTSGKISLSRSLLQLCQGIHSLLHMYNLNERICVKVDYKDIMNKAFSISSRLFEVELEDENTFKYSEVLTARFNAVKEVLMNEQITDYSGYKWDEWFEGTEKDMRSIVNLSKKGTETQTEGPWIVQAWSVREKLSKADETTRELEEAKSSIKLYSVKLAKTEKDLNEAKIAKANIEKRLADAHAKGQRLAQLEVEKKRLQDREKYFEESLEAMNSDMEKLQKKNKELEEEMSKYRPAEESKFKTSGGVMTSESGGLINLMRGGSLSIIRPGSSVNQEELETFRALIEQYELDKRNSFTGFIKSQVQSLPELPSLPGTSEPLQKLYSLKQSMAQQISKLRVVKGANKKQQLNEMKKGLEGVVDESEKAFEEIRKQTKSHAGVHVVKGIGTLTLGGEGTKSEAQLTRSELTNFHKLVNLVS